LINISVLIEHISDADAGREVIRVCTGDDAIAGSVGEALAMMDAALDYLNGGAVDEVGAPGLGGVLQGLSGIGAKYTAAWNAFLARFDANDCHDADGYPASASWLAHKTQAKLSDARAQVKQMRKITARPVLSAAMAEGHLSESWAREIITWTRPLPPEMLDETDRIMLNAAADGADLDDLYLIVARAIEAWKAQQPDPDDPGDGFDDRRVVLDHTFGGAGRLVGDLAPECAAAVQAVLDALGKKHGKEDTRTQAQRWHDALQEGCELLIRAKMVPDRAGSDTHVDAVISLAELRGMPGATALENAWLAKGTGHHVFLSGKDAEVIACDALIVPVMTGAPDWPVISQMIDLVLDALGQHAAGRRHGDVAAAAPAPLPPEAWEALQYAMAKLAIDFVSGPGALASVLRTGLLEYPFNTRSVPIDVGYSDHIPEAIRRAVILRDGHCAWPGGCDKPPAASDVHHTRHKKDGGPTSVSTCALFCQFHHDICVHRWGWKVELLPDGKIKATSPDGQVLQKNKPPPQLPDRLAGGPP
jgi:5-methylcytosine-specific restriction endonuclease McrA